MSIGLLKVGELVSGRRVTTDSRHSAVTWDAADSERHAKDESLAMRAVTFALLLPLISSLFEDQAGKIDW